MTAERVPLFRPTRWVWRLGCELRWRGIALFGLHMGLSHGVLAAMVSDAAPTEARGTAFGVFHLATGVSLLLASLLAGVAWHLAGPEATFLASAAIAVVGLVLLYVLVGDGRGSAARVRL